uniref:Drf_FH3 domain-containing protein n=1 Tax=Dracunculus medinensis TaxID=318479 RepID=A0A0N4U1L4_DRAME
LNIFLKEFFECEDKTAATMSLQQIGSAFFNDLQATESYDNLTSVLGHFIVLRRLNRFAQYRNRIIRDEVNRERLIVEECFLQLQNINSEIEHLQKEVERCYDFRSADENIDLVPLEEFYANAPSSLSCQNFSDNNYHELRLARLTWEMMERKNLLGTLQELEGRKGVLLSDIMTKEHRIKSIKPKVEDLHKLFETFLGFFHSFLFIHYSFYFKLHPDLLENVEHELWDFSVV